MALRAARRIARLGSSWTQVSSRGGPCFEAVSIHTGQAVKQASPSRWSQPALSGSLHSLWAPALQQPMRPFMASAAALEDIKVVVPSMGDSVSEGTVVAVLKQTGDSVQENDVLAQIETDKVTIDVKHTAAQPGRVKELLVKEEDTVVVGQPIATIETGDFGGEQAAPAAPTPAEGKEDKKPAAKAEGAGAQKQQPQQPQQPQQKSQPFEEQKKGPENVAPPRVPSVAPTPEQTTPKPTTSAQGKAPGPPPPLPSPPSPGSRPERRIKMTRLRQRVAERLKGAQNTYAMLTTFNECDMTGIMEMRNKYKDEFLAKHGVKLGFMSTFVKAAVQGLKEIPAVNAVIDGDEIVYRDYYDISIAVATPKGLVVPVLRNADKLSMAEIEKTINDLGRKAREGTISIDDMAGGTFTISNGGVYGSMLSTPIINPPQSAILGMHNITPRAMVVNGKIEPRPMMYLALTYDHRLIDGREGVTFLKRVKEIVEDPRRLLLEV